MRSIIDEPYAINKGCGGDRISDSVAAPKSDESLSLWNYQLLGTASIVRPESTLPPAAELKSQWENYIVPPKLNEKRLHCFSLSKFADNLWATHTSKSKIFSKIRKKAYLVHVWSTPPENLN